VGMVSEIVLTVAYAKYFAQDYMYYIPYAVVLLITGIYAFNTIRVGFFGPHKREDRGPVDIALVSIVVVAFLSVLLFLPPFSSALADNIYKTIDAAGLWK